MRIIAGLAKGKQLKTLEGLDTRPTLDRVKEAVFGSYQFDLQDSVVLDLFSGSGNLGLEAASRGAKCVYCNDLSKAAVSIIRANAQSCGLADRIRLSNTDHLTLLSRLHDSGVRFDFVFLDAPYASGYSWEAAEILFREGMISSNGVVIVEHSADDPGPTPEAAGIYRIKRNRRFGKCSVTELVAADEENRCLPRQF